MLVLDFGGQYAQLIARRVREARVYSELVSHRITPDEIRRRNPHALILSGGPASVYADERAAVDPAIFELGVPTLGICYGMQLMAQELGGRVERTGASEFGKTELRAEEGALFRDLPDEQTVWMSHRDAVDRAARGRAVVAGSPSTPIAAFEDPSSALYGVQFHPEVVHTPHGQDLLKNFLYEVARRAARVDAGRGDRGAGRADPRAGRARPRALRALGRRRLGGRRAARAQGRRRPAHVRVRRPRPAAQGRGGAGRRDVRRPLPRAARARPGAGPLPRAARGRRRPRGEAEAIGEEFIRVFEDEAGALGDTLPRPGDALLRRDRVGRQRRRRREDQVAPQRRRAARADMEMELVEPLRLLFKDEVRRVGEELGLPERMVWRHPFPGPGLAIRIIGEVTRERLEILREADAILLEEIRRAGLYRELWQCFAVLPAIRSVGVMGDERTYEYPIVIRAVTSEDAMTADWARLPVRPARDDLVADHQRDPRRQPRRARHLVEAARDDRVGVTWPRTVRIGAGEDPQPVDRRAAPDRHVRDLLRFWYYLIRRELATSASSQRPTSRSISPAGRRRDDDRLVDHRAAVRLGVAHRPSRAARGAGGIQPARDQPRSAPFVVGFDSSPSRSSTSSAPESPLAARP